jgi:hypothetical protein
MRMIDALSISVTGWLRESQVSQGACAWGHWRVVGELQKGAASHRCHRELANRVVGESQRGAASQMCHRCRRSRRCHRGSPGEPRVAGGNARRLSHGMAVSGAGSRGSIRGRRAAGVQQLCAGVRQGTHIASEAAFVTTIVSSSPLW